MKRTPLTRKTPMKRSNIRRVSKKRAKLMAENREWRAAFVDEVGQCQVCEYVPANHGWAKCNNLHVHEIAKGPCRAEALKHRACCLVVCDECNSGPLCDYSIWPIERQLAVKLLTDPGHFDLLLFNEIRGRAPTAITIADLVPFLELRK